MYINYRFIRTRATQETRVPRKYDNKHMSRNTTIIRGARARPRAHTRAHAHPTRLALPVGLRVGRVLTPDTAPHVCVPVKKLFVLGAFASWGRGVSASRESQDCVTNAT